MSQEIFTIKDLFFSYGKQKNILENISFTISKGEQVCILGPNGGGKSTLMKILAGDIKTTHYKPAKKNEIAYLPQNSNIDRNFPLNVEDVMSQAEVGGGGKEKQDFLLNLVDLYKHKKSLLGSLSGGQLQKLLIARLFALDRPIYLLDEPFNAIDQKSILTLINYLAHLQKQGKTIVMVIHDLALAKKYLARGIYVDNCIKADGDVTKVIEKMSQFT